ncbi:focadhesin isoform X2 [Nelusetta ayraudi]|uniref:focadhesin isoform X2 n=1 Tax=Nelusetta ayraudi TaxID=303726 RepID=UPI003F6F5465
MAESLRQRLDFPSPIIKAQAVRDLVAAVLKEKAQSGRITQSSPQSPALATVWQQCCSDCPLVRSACCDAAVLLVSQGHADLHYVLNSVQNLLPSASNVQGLLKVIGRLLQMQVDQRDGHTTFTCPYSVRSCSHPYITVLENRADCWPALLLEIHHFIQQAAVRREPLYISMLAPFLHYLYCAPQRQPQHALLRHNLLRVLLPGQSEAALVHQDPPCPVSAELLLRLCQLLPHAQVDSLEAVVELCGFLAALLPVLASAAGEPCRSERTRLLLHLLCLCELCLRVGGDCGPVVGLMLQLLPSCRPLPLDHLLMGITLLLLRAPVGQQSSLLSLALRLLPEDAEPRPWLSPVLVLPVMQLLYCHDISEPLVDPKTCRQNRDLARSLLLRISEKTGEAKQSGSHLLLPVSTWYHELTLALSVLRKVATSPAEAADWLLAVSSSLSSSQQGLCCLSLTVSHLLITGEENICQLALRAGQAIAAADPSQVSSLIPVLLFKLGREKNPSVAHAVLKCLSNLGTHKLCAPMVLHNLRTLVSAPRLRPVAMRLMTALWKSQDRVYPELQRLLALPDCSGLLARDAQWEQSVAAAACLRDICRKRPYQHGSDMLSAIMLTLSHCTTAATAVPAALALQGLQELCRTEVVDLCSTWRRLGPVLSVDERPPVVKAFTEMLALVPQLTVKSEEFENLQKEVVSLLWKHTGSKDPVVASCGYRALAAFPEDVHTVNHLPEAARPAATLPDTEVEPEEEEVEDLSIPGPSFMKLMALTSAPVQPAFSLLLTSLVRQEMSQMPRGIYFSSLKAGSLGGQQGRTVAGIPSFLLKSYQKNKQPGLKPGLAAGLLLCYELPLQTEADSRASGRLVSLSQSYQHTLASLIREVNIEPCEWHHAIHLPKAWQNFMSRAFHAVLQGRRADLEMQLKKRTGNPQDLKEKQLCAWLWARDQLAEVIETTVRNGPIQGNSILALSALAAALAKFESSLPADCGQEGSGSVSSSTWLSMVVNTLLSLNSSSFKPRGAVLPWFLHHSCFRDNAGGTIARCSSSLALALLGPVLLGRQRDLLDQVVSALQSGLAGSSTADPSHFVHFHSAVALGMLVSSLCHHSGRYVSVQKDSDHLLTSLEALEQQAFSHDLDHNVGCVLGLALVLTAHCSDQHQHGHLNVTQSVDKMLHSLQESSGQGRLLQEVLSYAAACVCVSAFAGGLIDAAKAEQLMNTLRRLTEESQQVPGLSLALGSVVHGLSLCGHGKAVDLHPRLLAAWLKILLAESCPTLQRLAAVHGLVALVGSESYLFQTASHSELSSQNQGRLNEVIQAIKQVITFSGAIGLQSISACLLGHLHLARLSSGQTVTGVPQDFSYLSERSLIRAVVTVLSEAGKKGPEGVQPALVHTALEALASVGSSFQYPPMDWSAVLSPLMRLNFGEDVQHQCVMLSVCQAQSSQSAALFLSSWLSPPFVHSLSGRTRASLYQTLATWMTHVSEDKLHFYVETLGPQCFQKEAATLDCLLQGVAKALATPKLPNNCCLLLASTTRKIFNLLPNQIHGDALGVYVGLAQCLSEMSDSDIDGIARVAEAPGEKTCFILAYLTSCGRIPLLALNDIISSVLRGGPSHPIGRLLLHTFYQSRLATGPNTGVEKRMEWLLELMGHIRNVAYGTTTVSCGDTRQATDFLLQVFAAAVVSWADHQVPLLLGVRAQWFPGQLQATPTAGDGEESSGEDGLALCLLALPHCLHLLLATEPWNTHTHKCVDWLLSISEAPDQSLSSTTIHSVKASLLALKSFPEMKKKAVWTRAYGW